MRERKCWPQFTAWTNLNVIIACANRLFHLCFRYNLPDVHNRVFQHMQKSYLLCGVHLLPSCYLLSKELQKTRTCLPYRRNRLLLDLMAPLFEAPDPTVAAAHFSAGTLLSSELHSPFIRGFPPVYNNCANTSPQCYAAA